MLPAAISAGDPPTAASWVVVHEPSSLAPHHAAALKVGDAQGTAVDPPAASWVGLDDLANGVCAAGRVDGQALVLAHAVGQARGGAAVLAADHCRAREGKIQRMSPAHAHQKDFWQHATAQQGKEMLYWQNM